MLDNKNANEDALGFDVATVAIKGARSYQEDSLIAHFPIGQDTGFAVLADGMGGHLGGHVASALVMTATFSQLKMKERMLEEGELDIPQTLREAAQAANESVARHDSTADDTYGMGSTLLATVINRDKLYWVSIGDSPLLLYRGDALRQLNKDHSLAPQIDMMVRTGAMSAEVGRDHPDRNVLTSAVSGYPLTEIDCPSLPISLRPDDILIIASDGIQFLPSNKIAQTLKLASHGHAIEIANALLEALTLLDDPNQDNCAFAIVKLGKNEQDTSSFDFEGMPVLATTDQEDDDKTTSGGGATADTPQPDEAKAYWYRGQKYSKDE